MSAPVPYGYRARVERVIDGDTFEALVDLGFRVHTRITVRVLDLRCPERHTTEGIAVTAHAIALLSEQPYVFLRSYKDVMSFARWVCDVYLPDGRTYQEALAERVTWTDPGR